MERPVGWVKPTNRNSNFNPCRWSASATSNNSNWRFRGEMTPTFSKMQGRGSGIRGRIEKSLSQRMRHPPDSPGAGPDQFLGVGRIAKHAGRARQDEVFQPRRQPAITPDARPIQARQLGHVPLNGHDIGKARKHGADGAFPLRSRSMHNVRLNLTQLFSDGADATLIASAQPADLWHMQRVIPDVVRQFFR